MNILTLVRSSIIVAALLTPSLFFFAAARANQWQTTEDVGYDSAPHLTTQDQPYAKRRPVTNQDRSRIEYYRSGKIMPIYQSSFAAAGDLNAWSVLSEEKLGALSCRRPESVATSPSGLTLSIKLTTDCQQKWSSGGVISKQKYKFGYFEASMRIAKIPGVDNAFWLTTDDHYEIDVVESFFPSTATSALHQWAPPLGQTKSLVSTGIKAKADLSADFHDYGVLWTPTEMIFAVDGLPYIALQTKDAAQGEAFLRLTNILVPWGNKLPPNPEGNGTAFRGVRIFALDLADQ